MLSYLRGETIPPEEAKARLRPMYYFDKFFLTDLLSLQLLLGFWKDGKLFSLEDCVHWARSFFEENYYSDIALLLKLHPPGSQTESGGTLLQVMVRDWIVWLALIAFVQNSFGMMLDSSPIH